MLKTPPWQHWRGSILKRVGRWLEKEDQEHVAVRYASRSDFEFSIRHVRFVSTWGLRFSCDLHCPDPDNYSASQEFLMKLPAIVQTMEKDNSDFISIHIKPDFLNHFAQFVAPQIDRPFILLSGDSDFRIHTNYQDAIERLTRLPLFRLWYAQNLIYRHDKIRHLPIGLDYHTLWRNPSALQGGRYFIPLHQEHELRDVLRASRPFDQRLSKTYSNWHFQADRGDRQDCLAKVDPKVCHYESSLVPRHVTWERQSEFAFVLSPEGNGMDCHRTWEAIALGCVPIIKKNELYPLFEDLPVLMVDDWSQVNETFLCEQADRFRTMTFDYSKVFIQYWRDKISNQEPEPGKRMRLEEFRQYFGWDRLPD